MGEPDHSCLVAQCLLIRQHDSRNPGESGEKKADLRSFADEPVAEIVQCGEPISTFSAIRQYVEPLNVV